ncbi:hypothetical protein [Anabaena sp. CCY 9910]|uniref:hypothetical protein n=1 Tax=Anabaena sp. CCY 9910 TaxID=3103870 RepID=UPI0039E1601E
MTYTALNKQAQSPLTDRDRQIIANIIQRHPDEIKTMWIEGGITIWVQLQDGGRLAFDRNWFAQRVAQEKTSLDAQENLHRHNQRLEAELNQACAEYGLQHGEIDYVNYPHCTVLSQCGFERISFQSKR